MVRLTGIGLLAAGVTLALYVAGRLHTPNVTSSLFGRSGLDAIAQVRAGDHRARPGGAAGSAATGSVRAAHRDAAAGPLSVSTRDAAALATAGAGGMRPRNPGE